MFANLRTPINDSVHYRIQIYGFCIDLIIILPEMCAWDEESHEIKYVPCFNWEKTGFYIT